MAGYDYEFVSQVSEEYVCGICELPMRDPVQTKCGHRFCRECLLEANRRKIGRAECPMDRQPLNMEKETFDDKAAQRSILSSTIKCPNSKCDWQGDLGNLQDHKPKCDYWMTECTLCGFEKLVKEMQVHNQEECEWRTVLCLYCGAMIIARELENHNDVCLEFPVKCPNQCGYKMGRVKIDDHIEYHCPKSVVCCTYREIGCTFECPRENLKKHLKNDAANHLSLVLEHTKQFQEKIKRRCDVFERDTRNFIDKEELLKVNQELKTQQRKYDKLTWALKDNEKQTQLLIEKNNKMQSSVRKCFQILQRERENIWGLMFVICLMLVIAMIAILAFTLGQIAGHSREFSMVKKDFAQLKEKLESTTFITTHLKEKLIKRKVIWIVNKEGSSKQFYTDIPGYKLQMKALDLPRIGHLQEKHVFSFSVALSRGEYDTILTWPFKKIIKVTLLDQNESPNDRQNRQVVIDPVNDGYIGSNNLKKPNMPSCPPFVFKDILFEEHLSNTRYVFEGSFFVLIETLDEGDLLLK